MAIVRARKVTTLPNPTQPNTLYELPGSTSNVKHIIVTDDNNVTDDRGETMTFINKKLFAAA